MDILSHGLYGGVAFGRNSRRNYLTAFFFGIGPDLFSFGIYFLTRILSLNGSSLGRPDISSIPSYVHTLYDFTHSFVPYTIFFLVLWFLGKRTFAYLTLGWPFHILVDMPVHSLEFFPTPYLWPISSHRIDGIPWSDPRIFIPNVIFIIVLYAIWYYQNKKRKTSIERAIR
mgnify:FL=1